MCFMVIKFSLSIFHIWELVLILLLFLLDVQLFENNQAVFRICIKDTGCLEGSSETSMSSKNTPVTLCNDIAGS